VQEEAPQIPTWASAPQSNFEEFRASPRLGLGTSPRSAARLAGIKALLTRYVGQIKDQGGQVGVLSYLHR
jgi:hypothetical protein